MQIRFEPLSESHLPTLTRWLQRPHVRAFRDDGKRDTAAGRTAGFIQRQQVTRGHDFFA